MALLDVISRGRATYVLGLGYRPEEFEHFGLDAAQRGRLADDKVGLLRQLLTGRPMSHHGRHIVVSPPPRTPGGPVLMWGEACRKHGHQPVGTLLPQPDTPTVTFVAEDIDAAWDEIGQHLLHDARMYARWNPGNTSSAGISDAADVDRLRHDFTSHRIISVADAVETVRGGGLLNLSPLCGGLPPETAWPYLKRVGEDVLPAAAR